MNLTRLKLTNFTAFSNLDLGFSSGVNVLLGANSTGKTHIMKVCYAACDVAKTGEDFTEKLVRVFQPSGRAIGRLVRRRQGVGSADVAVVRGPRALRARFSTRKSDTVTIYGDKRWKDPETRAVYIPVKEMLSHSPGFLALYAAREIAFDEIYADILNRASLPIPRGRMDVKRRRLLPRLQQAIAGKVTQRNEEFYLRNRLGNLEFPLLAEGMRKLGLLWLLIQNGTLQNGSMLFWDEPEANLNPSLMGEVVEILLELQRIGVQVFFATHDYVILKELELRRKSTDQVRFHALYSLDGTNEINASTVEDYGDIDPNAIAETFSGLYDRTIARSLGIPE